MGFPSADKNSTDISDDFIFFTFKICGKDTEYIMTKNSI